MRHTVFETHRQIKYPAANSEVFDPRGIRQLSVPARPLGSLLAGIRRVTIA